jgi:dihydropteroate synthase
VIKAVHGAFPEAVLSVDTYHSEVAKAAVDSGASLINDISGGLFDPAMSALAARLGVPYVCMHLKGNADTMHSVPHYEHVALEVLDYLIARLAVLKEAGLTDIIIDPGFGFSKTSAHNFQLIRELGIFGMLQKPLLVGISRKSTVYKTLGITPEESLNGSTVLHTAALLKGAAILRVHDVKEAMEAITLTEKIKGA